MARLRFLGYLDEARQRAPVLAAAGEHEKDLQGADDERQREEWLIEQSREEQKVLDEITPRTRR